MKKKETRNHYTEEDRDAAYHKWVELGFFTNLNVVADVAEATGIKNTTIRHWRSRYDWEQRFREESAKQEKDILPNTLYLTLLKCRERIMDENVSDKTLVEIGNLLLKFAGRSGAETVVNQLNIGAANNQEAGDLLKLLKGGKKNEKKEDVVIDA